MSRHGREIVTALTGDVLLMHIVCLHYEARSLRKTQLICGLLPLLDYFDINLVASPLYSLLVNTS